MTVRQIVDTAADLQVKLVATAFEVPSKAWAGYTAVRERGVTAGLGTAVGGVLRGSAAVVAFPFDVVERLRHREPATIVPPVYSDAATEAGAPGTATAAAEAAVREASTREAVRTLSSVDDIEPAVPSQDELPLPNYDHMTLGSLRGRLVRLSLEDLLALRAYEKAHADRLAVVTMLENRIAKLRRAEQA